MELHWLSILVVTIMVSNSTQSHHDTPQDNNSQKKGKLMKFPQLENTMPPVPYQYQTSANQYQPLANQYQSLPYRYQPLPYRYQPLPYRYQALANKYSPLPYTQIDEDVLLPVRNKGKQSLLQQQDNIKLKKVKSTLNNILPQLITFLKDDMDPSTLPLNPLKGTG